MVDSRSTFHCIPMYPHDIPIFVGKHPWYSHICQIPISFCLNHEISVGSLQIPSDDLRKTSKHPPAGCLCVSAPNGLSCIKRPSKRAASLKKTQAGQAHKCWRNVNQLRYWANFYLENGGITCSDRQKNEDFIGIYPVKLCNDNIIPSPSHINAPLNWPPKWVSPILSQGVLWTINMTEGIIFHGYVDNQTWRRFDRWISSSRMSWCQLPIHLAAPRRDPIHPDQHESSVHELFFCALCIIYIYPYIYVYIYIYTYIYIIWYILYIHHKS